MVVPVIATARHGKFQRAQDGQVLVARRFLLGAARTAAISACRAGSQGMKALTRRIQSMICIHAGMRDSLTLTRTCS